MNPYIVSRPANEIQVQKLGDTVRLNCSAGGLPLPKIIWLVVHGGIDLTKSELTINHFKPTDVGMYTCLFYNERNGIFVACIFMMSSCQLWRSWYSIKWLQTWLTILDW